MRKIFIAIWLLLPVAALAYHYGPGQERLSYDQIARLIDQADTQVSASDFQNACESYDQAISLVPEHDAQTQQQLRLERAKALMFASKLPEAHDELEKLVGELAKDESAKPELLKNARVSLANSKYYMTWLMRLEGQPREKWEPVIDAARQNYRLVAEQAPKTAKSGACEDLEASIRLARMDLTDLQGLPLPSQ